MTPAGLRRRARVPADFMGGPRLFRASLAASLGAHALLVGWVNRGPSGPSALVKPEVLDVDIRTPFIKRDPKDLRTPGSMKGAPAPPTFKPPPIPIPLPPEQTKPSQTVRQAEGEGTPAEKKAPEWVVPNKDTQEILKPTLESSPGAAPPAQTAPGADGPGGQNGRGQYPGGGDGTGVPWINRPPRLINRDEVLGNLRRFYPEPERRAGREGRVLVSIDVAEDGDVRGVDVLDSAGELFDDAARSVARLMRFEPALKESVPARVKVKQSIYFQLSNE